jgi:hypothetical protein
VRGSAKPAVRQLLLGVAAAAAGAIGIARVWAAEPSVAVMELFTSQSCQQCPPIDQIIGDYAVLPGIVAVTWNVTYWSHDGWADTLGLKEADQRQHEYALLRGDSQEYTPQIVVNGGQHLTGYDSIQVTASVAAASSGGPLPVPVTISYGARSLSVDVGESDALADEDVSANVWLLYVDQVETVDIDGGANAGRTLTYHNVVRRMVGIGVWDGRATTYEVPMGEFDRLGADGCVVFVQRNRMIDLADGTMLGAAVAMMPEG